jgi:hypothetical protein
MVFHVPGHAVETPTLSKLLMLVLRRVKSVFTELSQAYFSGQLAIGVEKCSDFPQI